MLDPWRLVAHTPRVSALFQPFPMLPRRAAQCWRHQPAYRRPRHFHEEPELNLVLKGRARLGVGDGSIELGAGELLLFEPGQDHELLEASPDLELVVMALRPELAVRVQGERPYVLGGKVTLSETELAAVSERAFALSEVRDAVAVERAVSDVFASLATRPRNSHVASRRAVGRLRATPRTSAARLGELVHTDASRLSRDFHQDLGLTLVEYRARLRLMRFVQLVDAGMSFAHAAVDADFGSYAQFHRVFQRALGCGPREYFAGRRARIDALIEPEGARVSF